MFAHFAREEEALFPFVSDMAPELADKLDAMVAAHDTICGALSRIVHLAATAVDIVTLAPIFERFDRTYGEHAALEAMLFREVETRLDANQRARLAALVASL